MFYNLQRTNYLLTPWCRVLLEKLSRNSPHFTEPEGSFRTHKRPPPVSILGQPNPVHIPTSHLLEIRPNIIHPSMPRSPQWSPSLCFPHQDHLHPPLLNHTCHMSKSQLPEFNIVQPTTAYAGPSGRAVWGVGLQLLACWDCGFESHWGHGCQSVVSAVCCQVEVSAMSWSLVKRSPTTFGVSLCVIHKPCEWEGPGPLVGGEAVAPKPNYSIWGTKEEMVAINLSVTNTHFIVPAGTLRLPWLRFSHGFSSVVRQMPG